MPDHQKVWNKQCPLGQMYCNCWYPAGKIPCPNKVCGAIYDEIIKSHDSMPPAPYWRNTDIQKWSTDHWSIAKCFINTPGYDGKSSAAETDCTGLLHLIINNKEFHNHIQCNITGRDIFSKVKDYRNRLFLSHTMELDDVDMKSYIADMIAVLQDGKKLNSRPDTQTAVMNLQQLDKEDFIIPTKCEAEVLSASIETIKTRQRELEEKIEESDRKIKETVGNLPTEEDVGKLEQRVTTSEFVMSNHEEQIKQKELEKLKFVQSLHKEKMAYVLNKLEFQRELIKFYNDKLMQVSVLPLKGRSNLTHLSNMYTDRRIVIENAKTDSTQADVSEISSMKELFMKDGRPIKSIYVVGEAGSGKSTFCKSLVNSWCLAHSEQQTVEDEFGGIEEMRKFEFSFYIPLSHTSDKTRIREMLHKMYFRPVIEEILDNESGTCLIILDGLDEWNPQTIEMSTFQTEGLPIQEHFKNYTIITTSRPWKLETLQITDNEIQLKVKLKKFDEKAAMNMIEKTVSILNKSFGKSKLANDFTHQIRNLPVLDIKYTPLMLQHLICLWFDEKLHGTSRCAIYSALLEQFFKWNAEKVQNDFCFVKMQELSVGFRDLKLSEYMYLNDMEACKTHSYLIEAMSRLAYETLFNSKKEMSVSFDSASFEHFERPDNVKDCCLKLGILSEDEEKCLAVSRRPHSRYSFVHKSEQEFLAAVYIALHAQTMLKNADKSNRSIQIVHECLQCVTVEDILDKENVLIMLSGLEPHLATYILKYVNNIVSDDKRVNKYRTSVFFQDSEKQEYKCLLSNIEDCIFSCLDEVLARNTNCESRFHLGDVVIDTEEKCDRFLQYCDKKSIMSESVRSLYLEMRSFTSVKAEKMNNIFRYLSDCRQLAAVKIRDTTCNEMNSEIIQCIGNILEANVSTLQCVSLEIFGSCELNPICKTISCLPSMSRLVTLNISGFSVPHEQSCLLGSFLSCTEHLEEILIYIRCDCSGKHDLDLSKHKNLRSLELGRPFHLMSASSSHLENFQLFSVEESNLGQMFDILFVSYNLKYLELYRHLNKHCETLTQKLIMLLPSLHQLRELRLNSFTLTDNIITCPSEMKYLERIRLEHITMSVTSWRKFVYSLPAMPHSVRVDASFRCLTQDGEEFNQWTELYGSGEEAAAFRYVREQEAFSTVDSEIGFCYITFSTKK